jgi:hypothetical protein
MEWCQARKETAVKRLTSLAVLVILIAAVPAFALDDNRDPARTANYERDRHTVIDDVIRMSQAGVSDDAIIKFVRQSRDRYVLNADTIIALNDAKVSKVVIDAMMDQAYDRGDDRGRTVTRDRVYVQAYPYGYGYGGYDPFYSPNYYDPFWYGPRLSFGIGFGGFRGGFRGGHFRGHR